MSFRLDSKVVKGKMTAKSPQPSHIVMCCWVGDKRLPCSSMPASRRDKLKGEWQQLLPRKGSFLGEVTDWVAFGIIPVARVSYFCGVKAYHTVWDYLLQTASRQLAYQAACQEKHSWIERVSSRLERPQHSCVVTRRKKNGVGKQCYSNTQNLLSKTSWWVVVWRQRKDSVPADIMTGGGTTSVTKKYQLYLELLQKGTEMLLWDVLNYENSSVLTLCSLYTNFLKRSPILHFCEHIDRDYCCFNNLVFIWSDLI